MAEQKQIQKKISFCFVFVNLRGKFILCYNAYAYAYVASENQALGAVHMSRASPTNQVDSILSPLMGA